MKAKQKMEGGFSPHLETLSPPFMGDWYTTHITFPFSRGGKIIITWNGRQLFPIIEEITIPCYEEDCTLFF